MTAPSNANTSGLEVAAWRWRFRPDGVWNYQEAQQHIPDVTCEPLVTAASAQARIAELEAELEEARTIDAGFWKWLGERDLQPDGPDVEWGDIVVALTEHEDNAYGIADKANDRATAAEARADRLADIVRLLDECIWFNPDTQNLEVHHDGSVEKARAALTLNNLLAAAPASPLPGGGDEALIAELKEARQAIKPLADCEIIEPDQPLADDITARYLFSMGEIRAARAFLARNGKGEG